MLDFKELSLNITEPEYRKDSAISYSDLSSYKKLGESYILDKPIKKFTKYFLFGGAVDCLLTEAETFNDKYYLSRNINPSDNIINIIKDIYNNHYNSTIKELKNLDNSIILESINKFNFGCSWLEKTKIKKVITSGNNYWKDIINANGKSILDPKDYKDAKNCVNTLKNHKETSYYFNNKPIPNVKKYNQLKFRLDSKLLPYPVRCMFDLIIVDYANKTIEPIDLKTTGKLESEFMLSFIDFNYYIQSQLYSFILREIILASKDYKNFKVLPFKFICINRKSKSPMIYTDIKSNNLDDRTDYNNNIISGTRTILEDYVKVLCIKKENELNIQKLKEN